MKGIVFAAGIGSRLKPFTDSHPKALAEVGGTPVLGRAIQRLADAGATGVVVNVHHFADQIRRYLSETDLGVPVEISDETELLLDTAGGLAKMARESQIIASATASEPIVVHNADIVTDFSIASMVDAHTESGADVTLLVDERRASSRAFLFDDSSYLRGWYNAKTGAIKPEGIDTAGLRVAAFGGVHVMSRAMMELISTQAGAIIQPYSVTDWYLANLPTLKIASYTPPRPYRWHDIGTPEKLEAARQDFK